MLAVDCIYYNGVEDFIVEQANRGIDTWGVYIEYPGEGMFYGPTTDAGY